jgi:dipeptidyl aminopeptidase/acylaminoacyl peptidase
MTRQRFFLSILILFLCIHPLTSHAQNVSARDLLIKNISELELSPDATSAVFTEVTPNIETNHNDIRVFSLGVKSGKIAPVERLPSDVSSIRWSPDGRKIAFFGTVQGKKSVATLEVSSGRITRLCDYERSNRFLSKSANMLAWSPDGSMLAFSGTLGGHSGNDPIVYTRTEHRNRTGLSDGLPVHIYLVAASGGEPRLLTSGEYDEHSMDWSADGKEIVFVSNREKDPDLRLNYDIFAVNVASGAQRQITKTAGVEMDPHVSPDGKWIAYTATHRKVTTIDSVAEDAHVWVIPFGGGEGKDLTASLDRRCSSPQWTTDSQNVDFLATDHGRVGLFSVQATGGAVRRIFMQDGQLQIYRPLQPNQFLAVRTDAVAPPELGVIDSQSGWRPLTSINTGTVSKIHPVAPEHVTFSSFDGTPVEGWLYVPKSSAPVPTILFIHGGPHGAFGYFFDNHAQYYALRGYAVLVINPRGSSGYGQKFSDGTQNDWGGGDYQDLMTGLDYVLKTHKDLEPKNLFVTGGSYGGYMTEWIITQTQRFRAAALRAGVSNLISFYGTSLYPDLVEAEFNGNPWDGANYTKLWQRSAMSHVSKATTPTLFLHGERDKDVPFSQSEEMYTALKRNGVESELVLYPREGHGFQEPAHRVDEMEREIDWFDKHRGMR